MDSLTRFWIERQANVSGNLKETFALLWHLAGERPGVVEDLTLAAMTKKTNFSADTLEGRLKKLEEAGLIQRERLGKGVFRVDVFHPIPEHREAMRSQRVVKPTPRLDALPEPGDFDLPGIGRDDGDVAGYHNGRDDGKRDGHNGRERDRPITSKPSEIRKPPELANGPRPVERPKSLQKQGSKQSGWLEMFLAEVAKNASPPVVRAQSRPSTSPTNPPPQRPPLTAKTPSQRPPSQYTNSTIVESCLKTNCSTIGDVLNEGAVVSPLKSDADRRAEKRRLVQAIRSKVITAQTDPKSEYLCIMVADMILDGKFDRATTSWELMRTFALEKARNRGGAVQGLLNLEFGEQEVERYRTAAVAEWKAKNPYRSHQRLTGGRR